MEVHNISIDDNEEDTSGDDCDDEEHDSLFQAFLKSEDFSERLKKPRAPFLHSRGSKTIFTTSTSFQNQFRSWERSGRDLDTLFYSSSSLQEQPESFEFFLLDTLSTVTRIKHPGIRLDASIDGLPLHNVMRLFGVTTKPKTVINSDDTDDGPGSEGINTAAHETTSISVCCNVHGFLPYFYLLPDITTFDDIDEEEYWEGEKGTFQSWLNKRINALILEDATYLEYHDFVSEGGKSIARIDIIKAGKVDSGIYGYYETKQASRSKSTIFLKVFCTLPRFIWTAHSSMHGARYEMWKFQCYETNLNNTLRFLTDRNITGCAWFEIKANKYFVRNSDDLPGMESHCQIEVDVHYKNIVQLGDSHPRYKFHPPPLRVLSFDIEVMTSADDLTSPLDGKRQVIQIGAVLGNYYFRSNAKDSIIGKAVFVLGTCDGIEDAEVVQFYVQEKPNVTNEKYMEDAEASLLGAWRDFIIQMDPDIITGYNIKKFDVPYLFDRSFVLSGFNHKAASILPFMGRLHKVKSHIRTVKNELKKVHEYDEKNVNIQGRLILDLYPIIVRHDKLSHGKGYYKLSSVAKRFLNKTEEKQDVAYTEIEGLQHGNSTTRNRMARYCLQDSMIPYLLFFEPVPCRREVITYLDLYFIRSRIGGPPLRYLLNKSVSYTEYFKQVRIQKNPGRAFYVPDTPSPRKPVIPLEDKQKDEDNKKSIFSQITKRILFGNSNDANITK